MWYLNTAWKTNYNRCLLGKQLNLRSYGRIAETCCKPACPMRRIIWRIRQIGQYSFGWKYSVMHAAHLKHAKSVEFSLKLRQRSRRLRTKIRSHGQSRFSGLRNISFFVNELNTRNFWEKSLSGLGWLSLLSCSAPGVCGVKWTGQQEGDFTNGNELPWPSQDAPLSVTLAAHWKDLPCQGREIAVLFLPLSLWSGETVGTWCRRGPDLTQPVLLNFTPHSCVVAVITFPISIEKREFCSQWNGHPLFLKGKELNMQKEIEK